MKTRREWILLSVLIVVIIVVLVISLHPRGYLPYAPITPGDETSPTAPSGLSGQADSHSQITIQWVDNSNNEDGFRIYRNGVLVESVGPNTISFADNDLDYATDYSYSVAAYNQYGETRYSTTVPIKTLNPPIVVTLGGIGVISDHDPLVKGAGDIYVYVAITDGTSEPQLIRVPSSGTISLNDNESRELRQQLFARDSVGDELRVVAVAFESDDPAVAQLVNMLQEALVLYLASQGVDVSVGVSLVTALLQSAPSQDEESYQELAESTEDDFVGAIEQTWTSVEDWGIGSYADVRNGDLRFWFTISTSSETAPVTPPPTPTPLSVAFNGWYAGGVKVDTATEGETVVARITLSGGEAGQYKMRIRRDIQLAEDQTVKELTFSYDGTVIAQELSFKPPFATDESSTDGYHIDVSRDGNTVWTLIDAYPPRLWVTTPEPAPLPVPTELSVTFDGWYIGNNKVNTATKSDTVIAELTLSGGSPGQYKMRVRRDIAWAGDATIAESSFSYDGTFVTKELAFVPPYASDEASTNGYHVDLLKDGNTLWTLTNAYPPRLWVTE